MVLIHPSLLVAREKMNIYDKGESLMAEVQEKEIVDAKVRKKQSKKRCFQNFNQNSN